MRVGHFIYFPGYWNFSMSSAAAVLILDLHTKVWRSAEMDGPCFTYGRGFLQGDVMMWLGNINQDRQKTTTMSLSAFDMLLETWFDRPTKGSPPSKRVQFSGELLEEFSRFLVYAGRDDYDNVLDDFHLLNTESMTWVKPTVKGTPPPGRYNICSCVHRSVYYCYGGQGVNEAFDFTNKIHVLKLSKHDVATWSEPRLVQNGTRLNRMAFSSMVSVKGILLLCKIGTEEPHGLRVYCPESCTLEEVDLSTTLGFSVDDVGLSSLPLENAGVIGVFGKHFTLGSYVRISIERNL